MGGIVQAADAIDGKVKDDPDTSSTDTAEEVLEELTEFINEIKTERWGRLYDTWIDSDFGEGQHTILRLADIWNPAAWKEVGSVADAREDALEKIEGIRSLHWGVLTALKERFSALSEVGDEISNGYKQAQAELEPVWQGDGATAAYDKFDEASGGGIGYKDANAALAGALDGYISATKPAIEQLAQGFGKGSGAYEFVTWTAGQNYSDWSSKNDGLVAKGREYRTIDGALRHWVEEDDPEFNDGEFDLRCEHIQEGMQFWSEFNTWISRYRTFASDYWSHVTSFAQTVDAAYQVMERCAQQLEEQVKPFDRVQKDAKITPTPFKDFAEYGPKKSIDKNGDGTDTEPGGEAGSGVDTGGDTGGSTGGDTGGSTGGSTGGGVPTGAADAGAAAPPPEQGGPATGGPAPDAGDDQDTTTTKHGESEITVTEPSKTGEMQVGVDDGKGGTKNYQLDFDPENNPKAGKDGESVGGGAAGGYGPQGAGKDGAAGGKGGSPEDEVHTPGEDGKIRIKDGDLEIVAEQPLGPDGATVVTVDDGKGEPTTQILGDKEDVDEYKRMLAQDETRLTGHREELEGRENVSKQEWDELKKEEQSFRERGGQLEADDSKHAEKVGEGKDSAEERSTPKSVFDEAKGDDKSSGIGKSAFDDDSKSGGAGVGGGSSGMSGSSGGGAGGGGAAGGGIGGSAQQLDPGARSGVGAPTGGGGAGVGTAPGGAEPAGAASGASSARGGAGAGMMGAPMGGGGAGGGGGDEQRSTNAAYQVHGGLFEPEVDEGPFGVARISGSLDDEE